MLTRRKRAPAQATDWDLDFAPFVLEALLDRHAGADRTGLTRIDLAGADGGEHAWRARVYHGHGPAFAQVCNAICAALGLPPVRSMKQRGKDKDGPARPNGDPLAALAAGQVARARARSEAVTGWRIRQPVIPY